MWDRELVDLNLEDVSESKYCLGPAHHVSAISFGWLGCSLTESLGYLYAGLGGRCGGKRVLVREWVVCNWSCRQCTMLEVMILG